MTDRGFIIAIDGPAGSGKSTTARACARRLGFHHLDTGAMYRAATLAVLESGVDPADGRALGRVLGRLRLSLDWRPGGLRIRLGTRDVTSGIRAPQVSALVSEVSAIPAVRRVMVARQRQAARGRNLVCEGRDIGSVVFPAADLKVYLDCAIGERSARREHELESGGVSVSRRAVRRNLAKRDRIDSGRRMSPLRRVADAVLVDTTFLTVAEQVAVVCSLARRRMAARQEDRCDRSGE